MERPTQSAAVAETHTAIVFFAGDRAYKVKKPVSLGFLDFSTPEQRRTACESELQLNRRLAPDVYLGTADLLGPEPAARETVLVMRRMPAGRRLSTLVSAGEPVAAALRDVARQMAVFHASAPTSVAIRRAASAEALRANWEDNLAGIRASAVAIIDGESLDRVHALFSEYLSGRTQLFVERSAAGLARDGHGDLLADDIFCLEDGPRILDCLDFDERLRAGDVLLDVAFLAMDLEHLGAVELAEYFLGCYREFAAETYPASLARHFIAYRASVRAKVACLRHAQGDPAAATAVQQLLRLCQGHLESARVRLVLVGGLPGTGKSTVAADIAARYGWVLLRSDELRKEGVKSSSVAADRASYGSGLYDADQTAVTYAELLRRAQRALERGESVVLDATWSDDHWRRRACAVAEDSASGLVEVCCQVEAKTANDRILARHGDVSDATPDIAARMRQRWEPWSHATVLQTDGRLEDTLAAARTLVGVGSTAPPLSRQRV